MNLISCDGCGVVLDKDKLIFPKDIYLDDGSIDHTKAVWDGTIGWQNLSVLYVVTKFQNRGGEICRR